jgi:hypothetical protein
VNTRAPWLAARTARTALACAAVVLALTARPIAADPVQVTSGSLDLHLQTGVLTLAGNRGFTFQSHLSTVAVNFGPNTCNGDPLHCVPGGTLSLLAHWTGSDAVGTATLDGINYLNVGSSSSPSSMDFTFTGSLVLPPLAPSAAITVPFTFTDTFSHPLGTLQGVQDVITGGGSATVSLAPSAAVPGAWQVLEVQYSFTGALPGGWLSADVGDVGQQGSASSVSAAFTVAGAGADVWGTEDAFHFVYQPMPDGNVDLMARIDSVSSTQAFAKAGVMIRQSLDPGAARVILDVKPDGGVELMVRSTSGDITQFVAGVQGAFPIWLKLSRYGDTVTGFAFDGASWVGVGSVTLPLANSLLGLAVTSHDPSALNTAVFGGVTLSHLPAGWTQHDIGAVGLPGSASGDLGVFALTGAGSDIWGTADSFHFVAGSLPGDGEIVARVTSESAVNTYAKAGVMMRTSLSPGSADVILDARPDGGLEFMSRSTSGGETSFLGGATAAFPVWLRLVRSGSQFTGYASTDGTSWSFVGSILVTDNELGAPAYGGLVVTSHDPSAWNTSVFDRVSITGAITKVNLVQQGGFEGYAPPALGGSSGWLSDPMRQTPAFAETNQPHSGSNNGACSTSSQQDCGLFQEIVAPASGAYAFTAFANADRDGAYVGVDVNGVLQAATPIANRGFRAYGDPYGMTFSASQ